MEEKEEEENKVLTDLDRAEALAERLKRENDRKEDLINREESLYARKLVGGIADAGNEKPIEESPKDYAKRVMSGKI